MTWHLMHHPGERQTGSARVLLDDEAYASWATAPDSGRVSGRPLRADGSASYEETFDACELAPALRAVPRLPRRLADAAAWEASLEHADTDRFWAQYEGLERASVAFFQEHLADDARLDALMRALDEALADSPLDSEVHRLARGSALFAYLADADTGEPLDDPAGVPGPLPEALQDVLRGAASAATSCADTDTRQAAALLALALATVDDEPAPSWARRALQGVRRAA